MNPNVFVRREEARRKAAAFKSAVKEGATLITDETALGLPDTTFKQWSSAGVNYIKGDIVAYNGTTYRVLQAHKSQADWRPDIAVSLFAKIVLGGAILEWVQPGSTNPYMKGDKVLFQGKTYESLIDNNVWSPTAYPQGWKLIS